jgi:hypothetical protein
MQGPAFKGEPIAGEDDELFPRECNIAKGEFLSHIFIRIGGNLSSLQTLQPTYSTIVPSSCTSHINSRYSLPRAALPKLAGQPALCSKRLPSSAPISTFHIHSIHLAGRPISRPFLSRTGPSASIHLARPGGSDQSVQITTIGPHPDYGLPEAAIPTRIRPGIPPG